MIARVILEDDNKGMIARIILESSIDYKNKFGPVVFTSGCNFKCGFCHNASLNNNGGFIDEDKFIDIIKAKVQNGWYNGICITGGEPMLHPELPEFLRKLKGIGLSVKIDTNGSNPEILRKLLDEKLIDYVAMDIKSDRENYSLVAGVSVDIEKIEESLRILSELDAESFELRTTIAPIINGEIRFMNSEEAEKMAGWVSSIIKKKDVFWHVQQFVSREKEEINDERLSVGKIPEEFEKTPEDLMEKIREAIKKEFVNCGVR